MRVIIILALCLLSLGSDAQSALGGEIRGRSRTGSVKSVGVDSLSPNRYALSVSDSVLVALTRLMKTNDSVSKNILNEMYVLWRERLSDADNKVGTRDTVLQDVYNAGRLKVETENPSMLDSIKLYDSLSVYWNEQNHYELLDQKGYIINSDLQLTDIRNSIVDSVEKKLDTISAYTITTANRAQVINSNLEFIRDDVDSTRGRTINIDNKIPSGLTVNSNRLAVYSPDSIKVWATGGFGGGGGGSAGATTVWDSTITRVSMTVTNLNSLANSATAGWGSDTVTNYRKASDYRIGVTLTMANTSPSSDKAAYVYICPVYNNNGTFETASQGTTTLPSLTQGTTTIAQPNNLRLLGVLSYTTQNMILRDSWSLSEIFPVMPDAWKVIIINFTGAAISASGNQVSYTPIFKTQR